MKHEPKRRQLFAGLNEEEWERLQQYIEATGLKKGHFVRKVVLAELDRREKEEVRP